MRAEAMTRRAWLVTACALAALGGAFLGHTAPKPRVSTAADSSAPKIPALVPDAPLPASTPAFSPLGPDLVGRVVSSQGEPIPGAGVFIDTARPRVGRGYT